LFLIYINDIDKGNASKILKFADDTKLYRQVGTAEDIANLRNDLRKLVGLSKEWLMFFNVEKCTVMCYTISHVVGCFALLACLPTRVRPVVGRRWHCRNQFERRRSTYHEQTRKNIVEEAFN
jgi:hypothetical protein